MRERRDRVRAAIRHSGLEFPIERITVNLAPADEGRFIPFGTGAAVAPGWARCAALRQRKLLSRRRLIGSLDARNVRHVHRSELRVQLAQRLGGPFGHSLALPSTGAREMPRATIGVDPRTSPCITAHRSVVVHARGPYSGDTSI